MGLDQADKVASVVAALIGAIALYFTIRGARGQAATGTTGTSAVVPTIVGLAVLAVCLGVGWALVSTVSTLLGGWVGTATDTTPR